jgi:response regulator RpfG family c-di-GMP phosphodiesterase
LNQKRFSKISQPENGNITLSKFYLNQISIIISNGRMLNMDGLKFYKRAEKEELFDDAQFLIISAKSERE